MLKNEKIEVVWDSVVEELKGASCGAVWWYMSLWLIIFDTYVGFALVAVFYCNPGDEQHGVTGALIKNLKTGAIRSVDSTCSRAHGDWCCCV